MFHELMEKRVPKGYRISRPTSLRLGLLLLTSLLTLATLVLPIAIRPSSYLLKIGDVAPQDILSPRAITYTSEVLTDQARKEAADSVSPIYLAADPNIARRQIERLHVTLAFITTVRTDAYASHQQKLDDLAKLTDIHLETDPAEQILSLNDNRWEAVQQESVNVLGQVMRNTIREDRLDEMRHSIPTLVSFSLSQEQAAVVSELVSAFVTPNSLYSAEQTEAAREKVSAAVTPITRTYVPGETVVLRGQVITPVSLEALDKLGFIQPRNHNQDILAATALVALTALFVGLYFSRRHLAPMDDLLGLGLTALCFLIFLFGARLIIPNRAVIPYLYPLPAFALTIAAIYNLEASLVLSLVLSILSAYGLSNSLDLTLFYILTSLCGVLVLGHARRVANFFWAGAAIGVAGSAIVLAYRLPDSVTDWVGIATLIGASLFNGLASASLTLLFQYLLSQLLGITTALQLLELSRPDHPLLQYILRNAPGTYQHSLQVANLAEQAAEQIGADPLLTRVGAIYHDAGKTINPGFFIENQVPGKLNPHDDLEPAVSAATIIRHVSDGLVLARKYRLPPRICDFIAEHHGTLLTRYQYARAVELAGGNESKVDIEQFRYPGPRPQSRETALLMLADGCEARARSELPKDETELMNLIKRVFERCEKDGQLDDTRLTLRDLNRAAESFASTLRGIYHPRIPYPELAPMAVPSDIPAELSPKNQESDNNVLQSASPSNHQP